ncbi:MAG: hypothetical protein L6Q71_09175, partial [Planctomycetes bacterium]|nr:hypothetical protein [Planctomycetota bacterium]
LLSAGVALTTVIISGRVESSPEPAMVEHDEGEDFDGAALEKDVKALKIRVSEQASTIADQSLTIDNQERDIATLKSEVAALRDQLKNAPTLAFPGPDGAVLSETDLAAAIERVQTQKEQEEEREREQRRIEERAKSREQFITKLDAKLREWGTEHGLTELQIIETAQIMTKQYDARVQLFTETWGTRDRNSSGGESTDDKRKAINDEASAALKGVLQTDQYDAFMKIHEDVLRDAAGWGRSWGDRGGR